MLYFTLEESKLAVKWLRYCEGIWVTQHLSHAIWSEGKN